MATLSHALSSGARLVGDTLAMWYGREEAPVLRLRPIRQSELSSNAQGPMNDRE